MGNKYGTNNRKTLIYGYLNTPIEQRLALPQFLKRYAIQKPTFYRLEGQYNAEKKALTKREVENHKQELKQTVTDAWERLDGKEPPERRKDITGRNITVITGDEKLALARKVYGDAMLKDASAKDKDLAIRMLGMLIEKQETTLKIDGSLIARASLRAERELRDGGYRVEEVQEELSVLPPELCLDTGQSQAPND